jgi:L-ascorbate metabolism protein UlaG (beta-lactamase superfamily)
MKINYYGHACVGVQGSKKILVDPYLSGNPAAAITPEMAEADYLLVTHGHGDHVGDAVEIAKRTGAQVVTMVELGRWFEEQGVNALGMNIGGSYTFADGFRVKVVPAWHSSQLPDGSPCGLAVGFIFWLDGVCFYHAGDTGLFGDMKAIIAPHNIDWAFLPIGDFYTMGPDDALIAAEWLGAKKYVPIHYNTFPLLKQDPLKFKRELEARTPAECVVLQPGDGVEA